MHLEAEAFSALGGEGIGTAEGAAGAGSCMIVEGVSNRGTAKREIIITGVCCCYHEEKLDQKGTLECNPMLQKDVQAV